MEKKKNSQGQVVKKKDPKYWGQDVYHLCKQGVIQKTLVITTVFVTKDFAVKSNLLL